MYAFLEPFVCLPLALLVGTDLHRSESVPAHWSPTGAEAAFIAAAGDADAVFSSRWVFGGQPAGRSDTSRSPMPIHCQIWLFSLNEQRLGIVDETADLFSGPVWSPDGDSLAYTHFLADSPLELSRPDQRSAVLGTLRIVRCHRNGHREVLFHEHGQFSAVMVRQLPSQQPAWSTNGQYLAAPWLGEQSLLILDVNGRCPIARLPNATLPSWSSDSRFLAYARTSSPKGYDLVKAGEWNEPKHVIETPNTSQPAIWEDGSSTFVVTRTVRPTTVRNRRRRPLPSRFEVCRVSTSDSPPLSLYPLASIDVQDEAAHCYFAYDPVAEVLYLGVESQHRPTALAAINVDTRIRNRVWFPFTEGEGDHQVPIGAVSVSPRGRYLTFAFGERSWKSPLALHDLENKRTAILAPNTATRMRALCSIAETAKDLVRRVPRRTTDTETSNFSNDVTWVLDLFDRPKVQHERSRAEQDRVDRLTRHGLALVRETEQSDVSTTVRRRLAELDLFFQYIRKDYGSSQSRADRLEKMFTADEPLDRRIALSIIRAQCLIGLGKYTQARHYIERLRRERRRQIPAHQNVSEQLELRLLGYLGGIAKPEPGPTADRIIERLETLVLDARKDG